MIALVETDILILYIKAFSASLKFIHFFSLLIKKENGNQGTWVAQSVECPALVQVVISRFVGSSPSSSLLLSAWSPFGILCPPPFLPLPHSLCVCVCVCVVSLSLSKMNKTF